MSGAIERLRHVYDEADRIRSQAAAGLRSTLEVHSNGNGLTVLARDVKTFDVSTDSPRGPAWEGPLAVIGHPTSDRRLLIPGEISNRDLPLPFLVQTETQDGHMGAEVCGRIDKMTYIPADQFDRAEEFGLTDLTDGATVVFAEGTLDTSTHAEDAQRLIENGAGVSIDMPPDRVAPFDPNTLEELNPEDLSFEDLVFGDFLTGIGGKISATTIVSIPAFEEASVKLVNQGAMVASAGFIKLKARSVLTASAAGLAPLKPPRSWFEMPEASEPTPLTVTKDGRVFGHLALWGQCHVANGSSCQVAPLSRTKYAFFHVGQIETAEGKLINVGRITVGKPGSAKGGHASLVLGRQGAMEHYDQTGCVAAFVRAIDGKHGIWLSGAVRSDVDAERIRDLRACPPSGDWRDNELVAVLSVVTGGLPIPRYEAHVVASAGSDEEEVVSLIASGYSEVPSLEERRARLASRRAALGCSGDIFDPYK